MVGMSFGNIAVDIFFVTSGFLIAGSFWAGNNITRFVWARILRIFPALFVAVLFCTFVIGSFFTTNPIQDYLTNLSTYQYILKNVTFVWGMEYKLPGVFANNPYKDAVNGSLWTLRYEVTMYALLLIFGLVLIYVKKVTNYDFIKICFFLLALVSVSVNIANYFYSFLPAQFVRLFYMFFVGSAFFIWRGSILISARTFALILLILLLSVFDKSLFFVFYSISLPYIVFFIAYVPSGKIRRFNKIGDYSYGIYIYAFPVQQSIANLIPEISVVNMTLLAFIITCLLSLLSWHFIEKPALAMKDKYLVILRLMHIKMVHTNTP
jgi:peptidoglycan/LPS O-acetylase OafA/YrhL